MEPPHMSEPDRPTFEEEPLAEGVSERLTPPRVIVRFFVIPLLLVLGVLGIYAFFGWLLGTQKSPEGLLRDLRSPYPSTREHALYDLTYMLQTQPELRNDDRFFMALMEQFRKREELRPEVRVYLALALGYLGRPEALPLLKEALADSDSRMVFYAIWAIGKIGQSHAGAWLLPFTEHEDDGIREMAVYALGTLRYEPARPRLVRRLDDPNPSVRMNAVLALARLAAPEALPGLRSLSRRDHVARLVEDETKVEGILLNAIQVASPYADDPELRKNIETLARHDPSMKVRNAAMVWLKQHGFADRGSRNRVDG